MASVSLRSVDLRYPGGVRGLESIDLTVHDGEFVALVGASGSGKTTLLRTVAGFLTPTSGSVHIGDTQVAGPGVFVAPEHRNLGMVFQQHAVWPHWNVARNVDYPLRRAGVAKREREERVEVALDLVGLGGFATRNPATLSGGQRQRVALARAIVGEPSILLLDEALSALDEPLRDELRLELRALARRFGFTVLHVTHDRDEALALADRVVVLEQGRIAQVASPPVLLSAPASAAIARFISDATIVCGHRDQSGFIASQHPLTVPQERIEPTGTSQTTEQLGATRLAIMPEDVELTSIGSEPDAGAAVVVSSLFGRSGNDVVVDWSGLRIRAYSRSYRPVVGEQVVVDIRRALAFANATEDRDAAAPALDVPIPEPKPATSAKKLSLGRSR